MLPPNPLLQLVPGRVNEALGRVRRQIWHDPAPVAVWHAPSHQEHLTFEQATALPFEKVEAPFTWGSLFDQKWFQLDLPPAATDRPRYLRWKDQGESTLYLEGVPYYGFDVAHHVCRLPDDATRGWVEVLCAETGIWHPDSGKAITPTGCRFDGAHLVEREDEAWHALHDLEVLYELLREEHRTLFPPGSLYGGNFGYIPPLERVTVLYRRMLRQLDAAVDALDHGGLPALREALARIYDEFRTDPLALTCVLTGHAHIDLVWLWPERAGDFKAVHTFASMTRLMAEYPEFVFNYTQPASYQAVGRRSPRLLERVQELNRAGQWEMTGASYVESDTQMACGEALARSLLIGQDHYRALRGEPAKVLWLPDVFGYTACLPQILVQSGVPYFFTTKLTWSSVNRFPFSSFRWQGHDGSEVVAHVTQDVGYNGGTNPAELKLGQLAYRQSDIHDEFLAPTGLGDGGGGPTEAMCERARRMADLASLPKVRWGSIEQFFDGLNQVRKQLPEWRGELYLEYHRGVMTTHSYVKDAFRGLERALQAHEAAACAARAGAIDPHLWERLVFSQFHDYIPGSSIHEVYDEGVPELVALAAQALETAAADLGTDGPAALFNPLPHVRTVRTEHGRVALAPLAGAPLESLPLVPYAKPARGGEGWLDNGRVRAEFDADGGITALTIDGRAVALAGRLGQLALYPDNPHLFAAWDIDRATLSNGRLVDMATTTYVEQASGEEAVLRFEKRIGNCSSVSIRYRLEADSGVLGIEYDLEWEDEHALLKVLFPTAYQGVNARYGHPFGSVLRSQQPGRERDEAQWEVCGSRWAAVCDDGERDGLFVVTEAKYGFHCRQGNLTVSLVRSADISQEGDHQSIRRTKAEHPVSDIGRHLIRLAIGRYDADAPREEQPAALADLLYTPPVAYRGEPVSCGFLGLEGGDSLQPAWAKPLGGGGWVLRLHETLGRRGVAQLLLDDGWTAEAMDLSEQPTGADLSAGVAFGPYQLLSIAIRPA